MISTLLIQITFYQVQKYTLSEIATKITSLQGWELEGNFLVKKFVFKDFSEAFGLMTRVALIAESENHHPDWYNVYNRVTIKIQTHEVQGITEKDVIFAQKVNQLF